MKSLVTKFLIIEIAFLSLVGCTKDEKPSNHNNHIAGDYIRNTIRLNTWANAMEGYNEVDTTYVDTFSVALVGIDSVLFSNYNAEWQFKLDTSNFYIKYDGSHSNIKFEFKENDSLIVNLWSYGGDGASFNQLNLDFIGIKQ